MNLGMRNKNNNFLITFGQDPRVCLVKYLTFWTIMVKKIVKNGNFKLL